MFRPLMLAAALALATPATWSQTTVTPAKKALIERVIKLQQAAIEGLARQLVERPAAQMLQRAAAYMQTRVEPEKREALGRGMQDDARKYVDETFPLVRERALKLAPEAIGAVLAENMSEAELREVARVLESAAWKKYQDLGNDMHKALGEKLLAEVKGHVEDRLRGLDQALTTRLGIDTGAASAAGTGK